VRESFFMSCIQADNSADRMAREIEGKMPLGGPGGAYLLITGRMVKVDRWIGHKKRTRLLVARFAMPWKDSVGDYALHVDARSREDLKRRGAQNGC